MELFRGEQVRIAKGRHLAVFDGGCALGSVVRPLISPVCGDQRPWRQLFGARALEAIGSIAKKCSIGKLLLNPLIFPCPRWFSPSRSAAGWQGWEELSFSGLTCFFFPCTMRPSSPWRFLPRVPSWYLDSPGLSLTASSSRSGRGISRNQACRGAGTTRSARKVKEATKSTRVHRAQHNADFWQSSRRILAVMLRCLSRVALLGTLLALGLGFQPMATQAASVNASTATADYRLTTSTTSGSPAANISGPQVVAMITPTGSIVPPTLSDGSQGSPLTVLPDSRVRPQTTGRGSDRHPIRAARTAARPCLLRPGLSSRRSSPLRLEHQRCPGQRSSRLKSLTRDHHHRGSADGPRRPPPGSGIGGSAGSSSGGGATSPSRSR